MFNGLLVTVGVYNIPLKYINGQSYKATKNVQDLDSFRDANGKLHRNALSHVPYKVEFETIPLNNTKLKNLFSGIQNNFSNALERSALCTVYIPELDDYIAQSMYMVQPEPEIKYIDPNTNVITYKPMRVAFVGY